MTRQKRPTRWFASRAGRRWMVWGSTCAAVLSGWCGMMVGEGRLPSQAQGAIAAMTTGVDGRGLAVRTAQAGSRLPTDSGAGLAERLIALDGSLGSEPVDAFVDRVWHAVPGLYGWRLDLTASEEATRAKHDGALHLVWKPVPPKRRLAELGPEPIYRGPRQEKAMALMFNVSWGEAYIPDILRTLAANHVRATFFLDGAWVEKHPDLARQIAAAGHAIGSHGSGHPDFRRLSDARLEQQMVATKERISHTLGGAALSVDLLAPPAGSYDARTVRLARAHGMYTVLWTVDTLDWKRPRPEVIVQRVVSGETPGALVLMHPTESTAAALPQLLARLHKDGYDLKTVDDVVHERRAVAPPAVLRR